MPWDCLSFVIDTKSLTRSSSTFHECPRENLLHKKVLVIESNRYMSAKRIKLSQKLTDFFSKSPANMWGLEIRFSFLPCHPTCR